MTRPKLTIDEEDERAVSPVIGVILMVAITVILAAVIGTFVLDLGQNVQNTGPSASMGFSDAGDEYDGTNDLLEVEHQSGESIDADSMRIVVRYASNNSIRAEWDGTEGGAQSGADWTINGNTFATTNTVGVGDVIVISNAGGGGSAEYSITVVSTDTDNRIATGTVEVI